MTPSFRDIPGDWNVCDNNHTPIVWPPGGPRTCPLCDMTKTARRHADEAFEAAERLRARRGW